MYVPELVHLTSGIAGVDYLGGYTSHGRGGGGVDDTQKEDSMRVFAIATSTSEVLLELEERQ